MGRRRSSRSSTRSSTQGVSPGYGAGWHAHLDQLEGHLAGDVPEWDALFEALRPRYAELVAATA